MNVLFVYMRDCAFCLDTLKKKFASEGVNAIAIERTRLSKKHFVNMDFVVVVAGDGTFLKTSHFVDKIPMVGVNVTPKKRIGFFCKADMESAIQKFRAWRAGRLKPLKLKRLEAVMIHKGKKTKLFRALNEVFVGCQTPFHVSSYNLAVNGKKEYQRSSGLLISTAAGSHGWIKNAGGKKLPITSSKMQFIVREPVQSRIVKMKMLKGILPGNSKIEVVSQVDGGIIAIDSFYKYWKFPRGAKLTVKQSKAPLLFIK